MKYGQNYGGLRYTIIIFDISTPNSCLHRVHPSRKTCETTNNENTSQGLDNGIIIVLIIPI